MPNPAFIHKITEYRGNKNYTQTLWPPWGSSGLAVFSWSRRSCLSLGWGRALNEWRSRLFKPASPGAPHHLNCRVAGCSLPPPSGRRRYTPSTTTPRVVVDELVASGMPQCSLLLTPDVTFFPQAGCVYTPYGTNLQISTPPKEPFYIDVNIKKI